MVIIDGTTIIMTRGDTLRVELVLEDLDGNPYIPAEDDVIRFAVKKHYLDTNPLIHKIIPNDTLLLTLKPEDTKQLYFGDYVYDIEITYEDGDVDTFIPNASFILKEEVM